MDIREKKADDRRLPQTVVEALGHTASFLHQRERWVPNLRGAAISAVPRIIRIAGSLSSWAEAEGQARMHVRGGLLRILAYLRAESRLAVLIELAKNRPEALDDLLLGPIPPETTAHRYNVLASLGIMAKNSLLNEVMTPQRLREVAHALARVHEEMTE